MQEQNVRNAITNPENFNLVLYFAKTKSGTINAHSFVPKNTSPKEYIKNYFDVLNTSVKKDFPDNFENYLVDVDLETLEIFEIVKGSNYGS